MVLGRHHRPKPNVDTAAKVHTSLSSLCDTREKRFLQDLMREASPALDDYPLPELHALLLALERMWGGERTPSIMVPPRLMYYLVVYATYAHHIPEDVGGWRSGAVHDVHEILQGFMESVALAIQDASVVKHKDDGIYIDLFRIPQWFYDEVVKDHLHM